MRGLLILPLLLALALPAAAATLEKPPELKGKIAAAAPYGTASFSKMLLHVYDAALWTDATQWSDNATYALEIRYDMHFTVQELADRSISEMERSGKMAPEEKTRFKTELAQRFHDVKPGDIITALYQPKNGGTFYYNGKPQGDKMPVADMKRFLAIWLGPDTSEPELRAALLKGK